MWLKVIFLDIDGVLNGYNFWNLLGWRLVCLTRNQKIKQWYREATEPFGIHERKFKRLAKIVHKTDACVVISSSWRRRLFETSIEEQSDDELKFWDLCEKYNICVYDKTPYLSYEYKRQDEILSWLSKHQEVEKFVILDDEPSILKCFIGRELVQTSAIKKNKIIMGHWYEDAGLKNKHVKQAIKILNS